MALKQPFAIKTVLGNENLTLHADPGESFLVKDIRIYNPASNYITLQTEKTTVGYFRVGGTMGSHLPFIPGRSLPAVTEHNHVALTVMATETAGDSTTFVSITEGDGTAQAGIKVSHAGGAGSDIDINTDPVRPTIEGIVPVPGMKSLLGLMVDMGLMAGYPVGVGETFTITGAAQANAIQTVIYEIYEDEDQKPDAQNGSRALDYIFVNYGNTGADITAPGADVYDATQNPGEFPNFPFGKVVPAKTEIDIIALLASDFAPSENTADNYLRTQYIKFIADRETLFDEDKQGILLMGPAGANVGARDRIGEGQSFSGNYSDVDVRPPMIFPAPLTYQGGDDLDIYLVTTGAGTYQTIDTSEQELALILHVRRVE